MKLSTSKYETNEHTITQTFLGVTVETSTAHVSVLPTDEADCRVECFEDEKRRHEVAVEGGALFIRENDNRQWYEYFGVNFYTATVTVYLQQKMYENFSVTCSTGHITLASGVDVQKANLRLLRAKSR